MSDRQAIALEIADMLKAARELAQVTPTRNGDEDFARWAHCGGMTEAELRVRDWAAKQCP